MPEGGRISVKTTNVEVDDEFCLTHTAIKSGRYVKLVVSDTGVGIPPELQKKIFGQFFTTKDIGKGSGVGLSTVYGVVK